MPFDWQAFNDPDLDGWLRQVMVRNNDVAGAVLRVYRARTEEERIGITNDPGLKVRSRLTVKTAEQLSPLEQGQRCQY